MKAVFYPEDSSSYAVSIDTHNCILNQNHGSFTRSSSNGLNRAYHFCVWKPTWDYPESIGEAVHWYRRYQDGDEVSELTNMQNRQTLTGLGKLRR